MVGFGKFFARTGTESLKELATSREELSVPQEVMYIFHF